MGSDRLGGHVRFGEGGGQLVDRVYYYLREGVYIWNGLGSVGPR